MSRDVIVIGFRDTEKYDVQHIINTTTSSNNWAKMLSPMYVGPVTLYNGQIAKKVENAWQFSKVYPEHIDGSNGEENPSSAYFSWAEEGWNDGYGRRYPMGKNRKPLYSYWNGEKLDYIEARKRIYAPIYAQGVLKTKAFQQLLEIYESGETFALLDYDGYDYLSMNMTLTDVMKNPNKKMGHAFVLAMLLQNPRLREKYSK